MLPSTFVMADLQTITPELFMCGAAFALLMLDLFISPQRRGLIHFFRFSFLSLPRF